MPEDWSPSVGRASVVVAWSPWVGRALAVVAWSPSVAPLWVVVAWSPSVAPVSAMAESWRWAALVSGPEAS